ncbi:alpha/beta fold hydrolase [Agromyces bauzanensis]
MSITFERLEPLRNVRAGVLDVSYFEAGPADGRPVILLHGFPYDVHSYVEVAPRLADAGFRVVVPSVRGRRALARASDGHRVGERLPHPGHPRFDASAPP